MKSKQFWQSIREHDTKTARENYQDFNAEIFHNLEIQTWISEGDKPYLRIYTGKSGKHLCYSWYRSLEHRQKTIDDYKKTAQYRADEKQKKTTAATQFKNPYNLGDILHHSWGYDQTQCDYYQVTEVKPKSVVLKPIAAKSCDTTGPMAEMCLPVKDHFVSGHCALKRYSGKVSEVTKKVSFYTNKDGTLQYFIPVPYGWCDLWNGKKNYHSWYA